ncbi:unnamed protein product [Haemonchus placei]|uniref:Peptidase A2 domain-containing protein n=1 Tax=Haemonchus placei TaxID=6290 RepID=A0A158QQG3_HAEPC|nr:unnamed protein product [Haemonchus placei]
MAHRGDRSPPAPSPRLPTERFKPAQRPNLDVSYVDIDSSPGWPRAAVVSTAVLSLDTHRPYFTAQVPIRANGVCMLALIDTGAGVTVASQTLLPLLGIFHMGPCRVPAAVGMAGTPVKFAGCANVTIKLGNTEYTQLIHFTEGLCVPRSVDAYNIILGNDFLQRLPPWTLNYPRRLFLVGSDTLPIVTTTSPSSPPDLPTEISIPVRAAETVLEQPSCHYRVMDESSTSALAADIVSPVSNISADSLVGSVSASGANVQPSNTRILVTEGGAAQPLQQTATGSDQPPTDASSGHSASLHPRAKAQLSDTDNDSATHTTRELRESHASPRASYKTRDQAPSRTRRRNRRWTHGHQRRIRRSSD